MNIFSKMKYVTYENRRNPHIAIHKVECKQIAKNGGTGEGAYACFENYADVRKCAETTSLEINDCSFCNPKQ